MKNASDEYASKLSIGSTEKTLYSLGWKVDELIRLQEVGRQLFAEISSVRDLVMDPNVNTVAINVPQRLVKLKETLTSFIKGIVLAYCTCMCTYMYSHIANLFSTTCRIV